MATETMGRPVKPTVHAAGGIVLRVHEGSLEVLVVHRPRYDDWSLPKGKADPGETPEQTARREVEEETGLVCEIGPEVAQTQYVDHRGRNKLVRYFAMRVLNGAFVVNDEVDAAEWQTFTEALHRLSYPRDCDVLARAMPVAGAWATS